jgi:phosphoribosylcarboxyaminoimidazole (NCAIR) mutase
LAAAMLANNDEGLARRLADWRAKQTEAVPEKPE